MRRPWVGGNWKMNGSQSDNAALLAELLAAPAWSGVDVAVAPPAPYWMAVCQQLRGSAIMALGQTVSPHVSGAHTGDCSVAMLKDCGLSGALVGHSERRQAAGETDALVAQQAAALLSADLQAVVCVGETLAERKADQTLSVVTRQLQAVLEAVGVAKFAGVVLAYEPVWAIGTGLAATAEQAQEVHAALRAVIAGYDAALARQVRIVYGGSVKADNAAALFAQPDIDGALVGGASLVAKDFIAICQAAARK